MRLTVTAFWFATLFVTAHRAFAQTSSIGARQRDASTQAPPVQPPRETPTPEVNPVYQKFAWISLSPPQPRVYRVGDLLTVIVRQRRRFQADADLETKKKLDITSELEAFLKPIDGGIGATTFQRGKPNVDFRYQTKLTSEGDTSRQDSLTTRLTATIIDVKPNGLLVLEGRAVVAHDEEISRITITGTCRKEDVTADNTVLSTQIADFGVVVENEGALRAASSRGWVSKLLDLFKPF